jgi:hypothetical protein
MTDPDQAKEQILHELQEVAGQVGGTVHPYPVPRRPVRQLVLRELRTETDTQFETAILDDDGAVYVVGADRGTGVSAVFGEDIQSYEWVYVISPDRVPHLTQALGGPADDDVLALLKVYYDSVNGRLHAFLCGPEVGANFWTWHS